MRNNSLGTLSTTMKCVLLSLLVLLSPVAGLAQPKQVVRATRLAQNPLITVDTSVSLRGNRLHVFFTAIGDAPERVLMSTVELTEDWMTWQATPAIEVLRPQARYECASLPNAPSEAGDVEVPVRQLRDPFVFEEGGRAVLFYATCGEQGIAGATLALH
jgi:hypothetical protein